MDINWYGYSCFRITERGHTTVVTDPHHPEQDLAEMRLRADLVTVSHDEAARQAEQIREQRYVIEGPGEYEVGELFVTGIPLHRYDTANEQTFKNVAYHLAYPNALTVLHLGVLRQVPDQSIIEQLDEVHALLLPVGGSGVTSDQLADLISLIEPNMVVPMRPPDVAAPEYAAAVDGFLKAMGVSQVETRDSLRITPSNLPEQTQVVVLCATKAGN